MARTPFRRYTRHAASLRSKAASSLRPTLLLLAAFLCVFALSACKDEQEEPKKPEASAEAAPETAPTAPDAEAAPAAQQAAPGSKEDLTAEGKHLYYYLLLTEALSENAKEGVSEALQGLVRLDPSQEIFQDSATILLSRGEYEAAASTASKGLKKYPDDSLLALLLAGAYSENKQEDKATALLEDFIKKYPAASDVREELVRLYIRGEKDEEAANLLANSPKGSNTPESELFRAGVLNTVGRHEEANRILEELVEKKPEMFEAWLEMIFIAEQQNDFPRALKALKKAAELRPDSLEILFRTALVHIEMNQPEEAERLLNTMPPSGSLYMQAALRFADKRLYTQAEELLEKAVNYGGNRDEASLFRSMIRQERGDSTAAAIEPLESIQPPSAMYAAALKQMARIYISANEYEKAHNAALEGRKKFPEQKELWGLEAYALVKLKKGDDAEKLLRQSLEKYPDDEDLLYSLGGILDENGKKAQAFETMEKILAVNPKNYHALNYIGYTLADENRELERALKLVTEALEQRPDADYIIDSLAWAQYRLGQFEEAWKSIQRCIGMGGAEATMWEHYGDIALALGKTKEAAKGFREALKRNPDNSEAVQKKLDGLGIAPEPETAAPEASKPEAAEAPKATDATPETEKNAPPKADANAETKND